MSGAPDLRTWWSTASPRERDAKVAKCLGWTFVPPQHKIGVNYGWHRPGASLDGPPENLPRYSTSWEHAGSLIDRLQEDGWYPCLQCHMGGWNVEGALHGRWLNTRLIPQPSAREAIALAFCLAKEVSP